MRGRLLLGSILGLFACADPAPSYLRAPDPPAGGSAAMFALAQDELLQAFTWDAGEPGPRLDLSSNADEILVHVLSFDQPLDHYGLSHGVLGSDELGMPLPTTRDEQAIIVRADGPGEWAPAEPLAAISAFKAARALPCVPLRSTSVQVSGLGSAVQILIPRDDQSVLVQGASLAWFSVREHEQPELVSDRMPPGKVSGVYVAPNGELWLAFEDGRLLHGDLNAGFVAAPSRSSTVTARLEGSEAGAPFELFALDVRGRLERFDGQRWSTLYEAGGQVTPFNMVWVGPGQVYFGGLAGKGNWLTAGHVVPIDLDIDLGVTSYPSHAIARALGLGSGLLAVADDVVAYFDGSHQILLSAPPLPGGRIWGTSFEPGALLLGGPRGAYLEWWVDRGYCPYQTLDDGGRSYGTVTPLGRGFVASQRLGLDDLSPMLLFISRADQ